MGKEKRGKFGVAMKAANPAYILGGNCKRVMEMQGKASSSCWVQSICNQAKFFFLFKWGFKIQDKIIKHFTKLLLEMPNKAEHIDEASRQRRCCISAKPPHSKVNLWQLHTVLGQRRTGHNHSLPSWKPLYPLYPSPEFCATFYKKKLGQEP